MTLSRYSGQRDIIINSPYGGRPAPEFEPLIGFFVNVLPLRARLHGDPSFQDLITAARGTALDGYENSQVAFHQIARLVASSASGQLGALSQTSLAFANLPYEDIRLPGLTVSSYPLTRADVRFPLELQLWEDHGDHCIRGRLIYRADLFTRQTAERLATAFTASARAAAACPGAPVSQLDIPLRLADPPAPSASRACPPPGPHTTTESMLLAIWEELLHTDEITVDDSFPDIGGHSLLVALMVAKIREELGADIPVPVIYQNPTARGIAAAIDAAQDHS
jgi:non-ribosomal peptide synthetase component F